jgi:hypothetical protein
MNQHDGRGGRIRFEGGRACLVPATSVPEGWLPAAFSVVSPGTERRHLEATVAGPPRMAGYMTLARTLSDPPNGDGWVLAAVPHGAAIDPNHADQLGCPSGAGVEVVAVARFQLMSALGFARTLTGSWREAPVWWGNPETDVPLVIGSGPVALGCVLELKRRGAPRVQVLTGRSDPAIGRLPGVAVTAAVEPGRHRFVVDATGRAEAAARLVAPGGTLALLGTPEPGDRLSAVGVHRGGWTVLGWHELAGHDPAVDQDLYRQIAAWLTDTVEPHQVTAWCRRWPGEQAEQLYSSLTGPNRPAEPVLLLEWT